MAKPNNMNLERNGKRNLFKGGTSLYVSCRQFPICKAEGHENSNTMYMCRFTPGENPDKWVSLPGSTTLPFVNIDSGEAV